MQTSGFSKCVPFWNHVAILKHSVCAHRAVNSILSDGEALVALACPVHLRCAAAGTVRPVEPACELRSLRALAGESNLCKVRALQLSADVSPPTLQRRCAAGGRAA